MTWLVCLHHDRLHAADPMKSSMNASGSLTVSPLPFQFSPLAVETGAVNLGQGFPNWASPRFIKDAMIKAVNDNENQYCRSAGHTNLVKAIAKKYAAAWVTPLFHLATRLAPAGAHFHCRVFY